MILRSLFFSLHLVSCVCSRDAVVKASLFILTVIGLTAAVDDLNGTCGGGGGYSVLTMQL